jgi:hypothetical protein
VLLRRPLPTFVLLQKPFELVHGALAGDRYPATGLVGCVSTATARVRQIDLEAIIGRGHRVIADHHRPPMVTTRRGAMPTRCPAIVALNPLAPEHAGGRRGEIGADFAAIQSCAECNFSSAVSLMRQLRSFGGGILTRPV